MFWIHRRSEEPSVTSKECYWKRSALSKVGSSDDFLDLSGISGKECPKLGAPSSSVAEEFVAMCPSLSGGIFDFFREAQCSAASVYQNFIVFKSSSVFSTLEAENFVEYMKSNLTIVLCKEVERATRHQAASTLWFEMRFARITASVVYDAARCKTLQGSLVERIMGAQAPFQTEATLRGKKLEPLVLEEVGKIRNIKIQTAGIFLNKNYPMFGASPDGISTEYCIEIKCPSKDSSIKTYVVNDIIQKKFMYQVQMQMFFAQKMKALFCVASPDFERSKQVSIYEVAVDKELCEEILEAADTFWKNAIFPLLCKM